MKASRHMPAALVMTAIAAVLLLGCVTPARGPVRTEKPLYYGYGTGATLLEAINAAKLDAVRAAVADLLGEAAMAANRDSVEKALFADRNVNSLVYNDTIVTVRQGKADGAFFSHLGLRIKLDAVSVILRSNDIYGGSFMPGTDIPMLADQAAPGGETGAAASVGSAAGAGQAAAAADEERRIIAAYVRDLTYMVYFNAEATADPFFVKGAVSMANEYLVSQNREIVDAARIEEVRKDRELTYEESTGEAVSLIQWIAQKTSADVYAEIDAVVTGETVGGKHYGKANITIKFFESSTARLLSSRAYASPRTFSQTSQADAISNAIQSSVYALMPLAVADVESYMEKALAQGIKYELVIQSTPDARLMRSFMESLERRVKSVKRTAQSAEETRYEVYLIGSAEDLEDLVYSIGEVTPGLEGIELIMMRGNSLTFHSGQ